MTYRFFLVCLLAAVLLLAPLHQPLSGAVYYRSLNGVGRRSFGCVRTWSPSFQSVISRLAFNLTTTTGDTVFMCSPAAGRQLYPHC